MGKNKRSRKNTTPASSKKAGPSNAPAPTPPAPAPAPPRTAPKKKAAASTKPSKPYRTPQTPHEKVAASDKATEYVVEKIIAKITKKGVVHYEIKWRGFAATTIEPIAHLAGCSALLRGFEDATKVANEKFREEAILKAYARKAKLKAEKDQSTAAKAERLADIEINGGCSETEDEEEYFDLPTRTSRKKSKVHRCFDRHGVCKLPPGVKGIVDTNGVCGMAIKSGGGTSNEWQHLLVHHPDCYMLLKGDNGDLTEQGMATLQQKLNAISKSGPVAVQVKLSGEAKKVMDDKVADWIICTKQGFDAGSSDSFKDIMVTATGGKYEGCGRAHVNSRRLIKGSEGRDVARAFHKVVKAQGLKVANSSDIWSDGSIAFLGQVSHAILEFREVTHASPPCS